MQQFYCVRNYGGEELEPLSLRELQRLQHEIETSLRRIRTRKVVSIRLIS